MPVLEIAIVLVLILINGVLAMSELAVVSARRPRLNAMAVRGVRGANRAIRLAENPGRFLSTVQIGITLVGILAGAFSGASLGVRLSNSLVDLGVPGTVAEPVGFGLIVTVITYLSLVAGELVPKQLALRNAERIACLVAPAMTVLARLASPFVTLLEISGNTLLTIFGRDEGGRGDVTEDEIRHLVAEAENAGVLEPGERQMIAGVMQLGDRPVRAVMTPRVEVDLVDLSAGEAKVKRQILASTHSYIPAHDGNPDLIIGILPAKALLDAYLKRRSVDPRRYIRQAPIIPDTMDVLDVVTRLKESRLHVGLVHDEFGHFEGIVTTTDVLEAIVGAFRSEEGEAEPHAVQRDDGSWLLAGIMPVEELVQLIGISLPEQRFYHTVAGLVLEKLGRFPQVGESFDLQGWRFEVLDLDGRRIDKVGASRIMMTARHRRAA
jgi:putative hemolysin